MNKKISLNQKLVLASVPYQVIGIDEYKLSNVYGRIKNWTSYTLLDNNQQKTWVGYDAEKSFFIQWLLISEKEFIKKDKQLDLDYTGIANITFMGNPGYSTPNAEITWFDAKDNIYDFLVIERFLGYKNPFAIPQETYYDAGKIVPDFSLESV